MSGVIKATINIVFSLILGAIAFAICAVKFPDAMNVIQNWAEGFRDWLVKDNQIPNQYNVWVRQLINDSQLVFMFFVVVTRIVLATIMGILSWIYRTLTDPETREEALERMTAEEIEILRGEARRRAQAQVEREFAPPMSPNNYP